MTNRTDALRAAAAESPRKPAAARKHLVGHGGVIDLHAYAAPQVLRTEQMEVFFGYLVRRLDNKVHASFLDALAHEEITPARFTALSVIGANPGVRQVDVARALDIARPAALKLVSQLVELGLVEAHPIPSDKRIGALALTKRGQAKLAEFEQAVHQHEARVCDPISAVEKAELVRILRKLLNLPPQVTQAPHAGE
jgi:DNA-binding MarR family transcriptional regulator